MKIIALRGKANTGKSTSLKMLIGMFEKEGCSVVECAALEPYAKRDSVKAINDAKNNVRKLLLLDSDIYAVFEVNGKYIGITTQGDSDGYLKESLRKINKSVMNNGRKSGECDVFICSVRTYGSTCEFIFSNSKGDNYCFFDKATLFIETTHSDITLNLLNIKESRHNLNMLQAKEIFDFCIKLLNLI